MNDILQGLPGVVGLVDDVLVHAADQEEHKSCLFAVLQHVQAAGVTLNTEKCAFAQASIKFLGHIINSDGIQADPQKTAAIRDMETPKSVSDLRRFLEMVTSQSLPSQ
jgi:recombinational DNA repair protein (RecF pathway)